MTRSLLHESIVAVFLAFAVSTALCYLLIPVLHRLKFGQQVREEGPQAHLKKQGTPTMGGIAFLGGIAVSGIVCGIRHPESIPVLLLTLGFGIVGFLDDYIKIARKHSEGLNPKQKMALQVLITAAFCAYCMISDQVGTEIILPFTGGKTVRLGIFYIPLLFLAVLGTDNGVNFTDGLDGLCSSVTTVIAVFFVLAAAAVGSGISPLCAGTAGALCGFLVFNAFPAKVFMGDTGSLALGGFVAGCACVLRMPLFLVIVGLVYLIEVLSVMIQVAYFRKTGGKRFFKMAPIHHHFELCGWSETRIVTVFTIVTGLLCLIGYAAI